MTVDLDKLLLIPSLVGGLLLGFTSVAMLYINGRICGVSSILANTVNLEKGMFWRLSFLAGLLFGGFLLQIFHPISMQIDTFLPVGLIFLAGLCVGFGTNMGGGCTSGHGVTGVGRLLKRSFVATAMFMFAGFVTATLFYGILGYKVG